MSYLEDLKQVYQYLSKRNFRLNIFNEEELGNALDVFPMEFLDAQENRELLAGHDVMKDIQIDQRNLRYECEFYLRSHLLKLRLGYLEPNRQLTQLLKFSFPAYQNIFRHLLRLKNIPVSAEPSEVIRQMAESFNIKVSVFLAVIDADSSAKLDYLFADYLQEIESLIQKVDSL